MGAYSKTLTLHLAAASANNICLSQSIIAAGNLIINGAAATAGVATLDIARRVLFTFAANETGHNFTVTGTNRSGYAQTEVVAGNASTAYTVKDFLTISNIAVDAATTGALTVGTNGIASSEPYIVDRFINPANITVATEVTGTVNYSIEICYTDLAPAWDLTGTQPVWYAPSNTTALTSKAANANDQVIGPITMMRLTQNSGTGTTVARVLVQ